MATLTPLPPLQQLWYKYSGLSLTTCVILVNTLVFPWASQGGMLWANRALFAVNAFDILYVGHIHWRECDYSMLYHHMMVCVSTGAIDGHLVHRYTHGLELCCRWLLLVEVSTWFNSVRYLVDSKRYPRARTVADWTFGFVFLVTRSLSSVGTLATIWTYGAAIGTYGAAIGPLFIIRTFWGGLTCLNLYWGEQIVHKGMGYARGQLLFPVPLWQRGMAYACVAALAWL